MSTCVLVKEPIKTLVVGVTTIALVTACIEYASPNHFTLFHVDATFKLSDLGYPSITCDFSVRLGRTHLQLFLWLAVVQLRHIPCA